MPARRLVSSPLPARSAVEIELDGRRVAARDGEPIAVALWAAGHVVLGRSAKYHRPRGPYCFQGRCDGCLMRVDGVPNVMTCRTPAREGTTVQSQNAFPSAELDVFGVVDWFFPKGMDHHEMMTGNVALNRVMQGVARHMAGLGAVPSEPLATVASRTSVIDVLVVGAGAAGLAAAAQAARDGASVRLVEEADGLGGTLACFPEHVRDPESGHAIDPRVLVDRLVTEARSAGASIETNASAVAAYRETASPSNVREVLVAHADAIERVRPARIVMAGGAHDGVSLFEGNDLPGVMSACAAARLLARGVLPASRAVVAGEDRWAGPVARASERHGTKVVTLGAAKVARVTGRSRVKSVVLEDGRRFACEALIVAAPPSPAYELSSQAGLDVRWSAEHGAFVVVPDETSAWAEAVGASTATWSLADAITGARAAGRRAAERAKAQRA